MLRHLLVVVLAAPLAAQQARYDSAYFAWQAGDYPGALARLDRLLASSDGAKFLEPVALLTGELYRSTTIASDGSSPRWSPDGRLAAFSTNGGRATRIVSVGDSTRVVASVEGIGLVFSPDSRRVAYFRIPETAALAMARAAVDSLVKAGAPNQRVNQQRQSVARLEREAAQLMLRDLATGQERELQLPELEKTGLAFSADGGSLYFIAATRRDSAATNIYRLADINGAATLSPLTEGPGVKHTVLVPRSGEFLVYGIGNNAFAVRSLASGETRTFDAAAPTMSPDGSLLTWATRARDTSSILVLSLKGVAQPAVVKRSAHSLATPAPSPDGRRLAYATQVFDDWEIFVIGVDGQGDTRITREIQHDRFPRWVDANTVLAVKGEPRHSRSYLYDVSDGSARRLHHNNTVRTVAPEYEWAPSPDGTRVLIVADRDGDTISPERSVTLMDLRNTVTRAALLDRIRVSAAAERDLRDRGRAMFALIEARVKAAVRDVSAARIYEYEKAAYELDSKHITQPGNARAIQFYTDMLKSFGYEPEVQWFEPRQGIRTANVIATLEGTTNPDLIYVVSSHFDSVQGGPGSDDDTSGSAALLEAARVLAGRPQSATIKFAFFTGEEAGLLGSREFVRRAVEAKDQIVGALNNDMIGWANDVRLDNTIRYSNDGIRDLQHAAAFLFTDLITYDARYYRSTDAAAYYEAYGDIVGGIGSYPILGNPHYHQPHDILETINHQLVAEVSKTTVASIMLLASSPSRLKGLDVSNAEGSVRVSWTAAPEKGVTRYLVAYGPPTAPYQRTVTVYAPRTTLVDAKPGWRIAVKSLNPQEVASWDWVRGQVP